MGRDRLRATELLTVLVDAALAAGDLDAAAAVAEDLAARTDGPAIPAALQGRATAARARVATAQGDRAGAVDLLEGAVDRLDEGEAPWLRATLLLDLARLRDDPSAATVDATAAASTLARLDVVLAPADAALLASLGLRSPAARDVTLTRDGTWWTVSCASQSVRVKDTKGLRYLALLVASPGRERHALDLVDEVQGVGDVSRRALGDAGPLLDARARADYRRRIEALRTEAADAFESGQLETAEALQDELDQLVRQLAQAFGLGGRSRSAASAAERARLNVTRALRAATARLGEALPAAGDVLDRRIRTGLFCAYEPAADDGVRWVVQS
jgi:tetratricopeptide (TPR) repeat protein